jgi:hypothetical protein
MPVVQTACIANAIPFSRLYLDLPCSQSFNIALIHYKGIRVTWPEAVAGNANQMHLIGGSCCRSDCVVYINATYVAHNLIGPALIT